MRIVINVKYINNKYSESAVIGNTFRALSARMITRSHRFSNDTTDGGKL